MAFDSNAGVRVALTSMVATPLAIRLTYPDEGLPGKLILTMENPDIPTLALVGMPGSIR
jgi:hypothetical protein